MTTSKSTPKATTPKAAPKAPAAPTKAPAAPPANSAAPGTKGEEKSKGKGRAKLVDYIEWKRQQKDVAEDYLIEASEKPADFKSTVHNPLKKSHFKEEWMYLEMKAAEHEAAAARLRKEVEIAKTVGSREDQKKMTKVLKMQQELASLMANLEEGGFDMSLLQSDSSEDKADK